MLTRRSFLGAMGAAGAVYALPGQTCQSCCCGVKAQVALQRFTNPGGLNKIGESLYEDSNNAGKSGEPSTAATLGATITPSALEMSNVDVANEFTDMIITQRGFQSNSKVVTTSDQLLERAINLKRS